MTRISRVLAVGILAMALLGACGDDDDSAGPAIGYLAVLSVTSPAIVPGGSIAAGYTCDGPNQSPALHWDGEPSNTASFAIVMEDPDAKNFTHWLVYDIPIDVHDLNPASSPGGSLPPGTKEGKNGFGKVGYGGPCPPKGANTHRYHFHVYALDAASGLSPGAGKGDMETVLKTHAIAAGELVGTFGH
jgi:Raf kinase inhibitor-like YbhB/YbcL family protein